MLDIRTMSLSTVYTADYERIAPHCFFPTGFPFSQFWNLMLVMALFSALGYKKCLFRSKSFNHCSYINSFLEGLPSAAGRNGGVVDVGETGSSPESHVHQVVLRLL